MEERRFKRRVSVVMRNGALAPVDGSWATTDDDHGG
ncbi:hypothetical protein SBA2_40031 [Acidobacteriia bacterium SbA2]|nr:hypothetical protein SBA2_40031 [Acidobacteriia bacterium SbA2]